MTSATHLEKFSRQKTSAVFAYVDDVAYVRMWTPRVFHAAEYVRTRTYACGLRAFSTRPDTDERVRTH
jgi:hypothetical protein